MVTTDIRLERIKQEYVGLRDAQDALMDKIDTYEAALLGLTEAVAANRDLIMANRETILANHEWTQRQIEDLHEKMDRLMTHLDVPPKPPVGFVKE
ncbi:MAG: hypothetical protein OXT68_14485 [Chloroflexota bacterium]|nr:hypothetical protein [Chloroflexota bacterium]